MLKRNGAKQLKMHIYTIEDLMPEEHFLRDLDALVDFDFIYEKVEDLYSQIGRGSTDPVVIIKMLLIGYLYGIASERQLEKEIHVNIAYRWFLRLDLDDPIPDHSTISQLRRRKFKGTNLFEEIFDEVVRRCIKAGLVDGKLLLTDGTHIKANVRDDLREKITVKDEPSAYMKRLEELALQDGLIKGTNKNKPKNEEKTKEVTKSVTDPDCGLLNRPGKPGGFHYFSYETVDGKNGIITDVYVTPANHKDSTGYSERIQYQIEKFGFDTKEIGADSGFDSGEIHSDMLAMNIKTYIIEAKRSNQYEDENRYERSDFFYDPSNDQYICPNGCILKFTHFNKSWGAKVYRAAPKDCKDCLLKEKCCTGKRKTVYRAYHQNEIDIQRKNNKTERYDEIMRLRQIWCEGNFSHQKARHCLTRAKMCGIEKVREQCLLSSCALNLKRLVKRLKRLAKSACSNSATGAFVNKFLDIADLMPICA